MRVFRNLILTLLSVILLSTNTISNDVSEFEDVKALTEEIPTQQQKVVTEEDHFVRIQFCTS